MALSKEQKLAVRAKLELGKTPRKISDEMDDVGYQTALSIRREMERDKENDLVEEVKAVDLQMVVERAKEDMAPKDVVKKLERVQEGVSGLQLLDSEFHTTMSAVLKRANEFLEQDDLKTSEWVSITNALSNAYNNIFNNKGVNVHVDNSQQISDNNLSMFKGALRG